MKKAEIKRRKRVVPATGGQVVEQGTPFTNDNLSDSGNSDQRTSVPPMNMDTGAEGESYEGVPLRTIPVDFTETFRRSEASNESKKRSFTARGHGEDTDHYARPQHATSSPENRHIDPSLPHRGSGASDSKGSRRAELQMEAEKMRQRLLETERQLAELGDDG